MNVYAHTNLYIFSCLCLLIHVHIYIYVYICMCIYIYIFVYIFIYLYTLYVHIYERSYVTQKNKLVKGSPTLRVESPCVPVMTCGYSSQNWLTQGPEGVEYVR